jgi:murein DD-endopeptidase MepM/ murein hydrolase activator NlpD
MRALLILLPLLLAGCPRPPRPTPIAPRTGFVLQQPFPCGVKIRVICAYGARAHQRIDHPQKTNEHYAVDFVREDGRGGFDRPVAAVASGTVLRAGWARGGYAPYGQMVYLEHDYRDPRGHRYQSIYAHLHRVLVREGQRVDAGVTVGTLGGSSNGELRHFSPHLHFALYQNARRSFGGGRSYRPEPMGGYRDLRIGLRMIACVPPGPEPVAGLRSAPAEREEPVEQRVAIGEP